jgi:hypothetical protein
MKKLKAGVKEDSNGSIILTASVAGLRSGAGPVHCESVSATILSGSYLMTRIDRKTKFGVQTIDFVPCSNLISTPFR